MYFPPHSSLPFDVSSPSSRTSTSAACSVRPESTLRLFHIAITQHFCRFDNHLQLPNHVHCNILNCHSCPFHNPSISRSRFICRCRRSHFDFASTARSRKICSWTSLNIHRLDFASIPRSRHFRRCHIHCCIYTSHLVHQYSSSRKKCMMMMVQSRVV